MLKGRKKFKKNKHGFYFSYLGRGGFRLWPAKLPVRKAFSAHR